MKVPQNRGFLRRLGDRRPVTGQPGFGRSRQSESTAPPSESTDAPSSPWCRRAGYAAGRPPSQIRSGASARQNPPQGRRAARAASRSAVARGVRFLPGTDGRFDRLMVSQRSVPKRALNLGSQNSHNPLSAMDLREIQWDFHVVCLNAPLLS
jgi:hypothetical protein